MRWYLAGFALSITALAPVPALAQNYPWCAHYGGRAGGINCGFVSLEQCRWTISGVGGTCLRNTMYVPSAPPKPKKAKRVRYYR